MSLSREVSGNMPPWGGGGGGGSLNTHAGLAISLSTEM